MAVLLALVLEFLAVAIGAPLGGAMGHGLTGSVIGVAAMQPLPSWYLGRCPDCGHCREFTFPS